MTVVEAHLTNTAYGAPRGKARRIKPVAIACIHVTGNSRTAKYTDLHAAAWAERNFANRADSPGPSAHFYVARDGWALEAVDPDRFVAWSNGDVSSPNKANPGIRRVLAMRAKGYNANEAYWEEFENLGYSSTYPITVAQRVFLAERIAARSKLSGLPVNRETVHGHWEINGIDRRNCPAPWAAHEAFLVDIIARANRLLEPDTTGEGDALRSFTFEEDARAGWIELAGPGHSYLNLRTNVVSPPIDPTVFGRHRGFGPVKLLGGGITGPTDTRVDGYIVHREVAFLITADVKWEPDDVADPAVTKAAVNAVLDDIAPAYAALGARLQEARPR